MKFKMIDIRIEVLPGANIYETCREVKELSELLEEDLSFQFNGKIVDTKDKSVLAMFNYYNSEVMR